MGIATYLLVLAIQGLVFGALARLALPGRDPMGIPTTIAVGIAGSFVGGTLVYLITDGASAGGFFAAFVASVLIVYVIRRSRGGGVMAPDARAGELRSRRRY